MQKHKILAVVSFLTGLTLSIVCAYFSIIGLTTLFSGAWWPVVIMGSALELGKLVTVSWLYHNYKEAPKILTFYLGAAVLSLMLITSMGVFGFLSKAHIDQQLTLNTGLTDEISILKDKLTTAEDEKADIKKQIDAIDKLSNKAIETSSAKSALSTTGKTNSDREKLILKKEEKDTQISSIKKELLPKESQYKKMEAEVGPVKYVAELIWGTVNDTKTLDKAVRCVIIILILVFDPLAIGLLLAFNVSTQRLGNLEMEFVDIEKVQGKKSVRRVRKIVKKKGK